MKRIALAAGVLLTTVAATASAQIYRERTYIYDPHYGARDLRDGRDGRDGRDECWNPGAGHFEAVRPGEVQNDLDFSRCRPVAGRHYERRAYRETREECWNPRAGHFEEVRRGERQYDLDFSRCRVARY